MSSAQRFRSDERGQVLVIVGLAFVVLLLAGALALDWGFGLTQRRVMQNAADAGAVAAGQLLVRVVLPGPVFAVTENEVFCEALAYARSNEANLGAIQTDPKNHPGDLRLQWADAAKTTWNDLSAYSGWLTTNAWPPPTPGIDCSNNGTGSLQANGGPTFDSSARYLRVETSTTFRALLAGRAVTAAAGATAFLHGANVPTNGPTWPITRHYTRDILNSSCGNPCSPAAATPVTFWSSGGSDDDVDYGTFHGLVDFSRYSPIIAAGKGSCYDGPHDWCQQQLIEHWDDSGPPPNGRTSLARVGQTDPLIVGNSNVACYPDNNRWVTWGDDLTNNGIVAGNDTNCSLPNWAVRPFGFDPNDSSTGRLSLNAIRGPLVDASRSVCAAGLPPAPLPHPSCDDRSKGDWVETQAANHGSGISDPLLAYIRAYGVTDPVWSNATCQQCGGGQPPVYGKYVVLLVYLWDCAETAGAAPQNPDRGTWALIEPKNPTSDDYGCSAIHKNGDLGSGQNVNRVHLFTYTPFTFFEGLVVSGNQSSVKGFWGGSVSNDPNGGPLNQFFNAVNLVD